MVGDLLGEPSFEGTGVLALPCGVGVEAASANWAKPVARMHGQDQSADPVGAGSAKNSPTTRDALGSSNTRLTASVTPVITPRGIMVGFGLSVRDHGLSWLRAPAGWRRCR